MILCFLKNLGNLKMSRTQAMVEFMRDILPIDPKSSMDE